MVFHGLHFENQFILDMFNSKPAQFLKWTSPFCDLDSPIYHFRGSNWIWNDWIVNNRDNDHGLNWSQMLKQLSLAGLMFRITHLSLAS